MWKSETVSTVQESMTTLHYCSLDLRTQLTLSWLVTASVNSFKSYLLQHDLHFVYSTVDNKEDCALGSSSLVMEGCSHINSQIHPLTRDWWFLKTSWWQAKCQTSGFRSRKQTSHLFSWGASSSNLTAAHRASQNSPAFWNSTHNLKNKTVNLVTKSYV